MFAHILLYHPPPDWISRSLMRSTFVSTDFVSSEPQDAYEKTYLIGPPNHPILT